MTRIFHWFFMYNIDPMSGFDITAQRQYTAVQKMITLLQQGYNARKVISEVWESLVLQCTVRKKTPKSAKKFTKNKHKMFAKIFFAGHPPDDMINWLCLLWDIYVIYMINWLCLPWEIYVFYMIDWFCLL